MDIIVNGYLLSTTNEKFDKKNLNLLKKRLEKIIQK